MKKFLAGLILGLALLVSSIQPAFAATAFFAAKGTATAPTISHPGYVANVIASTYSITATATAPIINDTYKMVKIPKGAVVTRVRLVSTDLDSSTTLLWSVGDSSSATKYISSSTIGQAGGAAESATEPITYTAPDYIIVQCTAAPTSTAVTTGFIHVVVEYIVP